MGDDIEDRAGGASVGSAVTEAANRAEVTALLIRSGYRVYRSEADIDGEDLVVRTPAGELFPVQLKGRATVEWKRYGGRKLWMLFPSSPWRPDEARAWFLVPHDELFKWFENRHGHTEGWRAEAQWNTGKPSKALLDWLAPFRITSSKASQSLSGWY